MGPGFWTALEDTVGHTGVLAHWRQGAGEDYPRLARYLHPLPRLAASYPAPGGQPSFAYRVVQYGPDEFVALDDATETHLELKRDDLILYEFDVPRLCRELAHLLDLTPGSRGLQAAVPGAFAVGLLQPAAGFSFAVVLILALTRWELIQRLRAVAFELRHPSLVLIPTVRRMRQEAVAIARLSEFTLLPLNQALEVAAPGAWSLTPHARAVLAGFQEQHIPS